MIKTVFIRSLEWLFLLFVTNTIISAQSFDPKVSIQSNLNGLVKYRTSSTPSGTARFYLTGDGNFSLRQNAEHQFEKNSSGYASSVFFNKSYDPNPPKLRVVSTDSTGLGSTPNSQVVFSGSTHIGTSWNPCLNIENYFILVFKNTSSTIDTGCLEFRFDSTQLSLNRSGIIDNHAKVSNRSFSSITSSNYNTKVSWGFTNLLAGEQKIIYLPLTSKVSAKTQLKLKSTYISKCLGSGSSSTPSLYSYRYPHDPNTKTVDPPCLLPDHSQQKLKYRITFQNDGNDFAQDVIILDTLDDKSLDLTSIKFLNSEYNYTYNIIGNVLEIKFLDIFLPGLNQNAPHKYTYDQTHSYIEFELCTFPNLTVENIKNKAEIFFDAQAPIVTNEAVVSIVMECNLGISCNSNLLNSISDPLAKNLLLYPNPVQDQLNIHLIDDEIVNVEIINSQGVHVLHKTFNPQNDQIISMARFVPGLYHIKITSKNSTFVRSVLKE